MLNIENNIFYKTQNQTLPKFNF